MEYLRSGMCVGDASALDIELGVVEQRTGCEISSFFQDSSKTFNVGAIAGFYRHKLSTDCFHIPYTGNTCAPIHATRFVCYLLSYK